MGVPDLIMTSTDSIDTAARKPASDLYWMSGGFLVSPLVVALPRG